MSVQMQVYRYEQLQVLVEMWKQTQKKMLR